MMSHACISGIAPEMHYRCLVEAWDRLTIPKCTKYSLQGLMNFSKGIACHILITTAMQPYKYRSVIMCVQYSMALAIVTTICMNFTV